MPAHNLYEQALMGFPIRGGNEKNDWLDILGQSQNLTPWGMKTLRSGLDGFVKSVIKEPIYICKDHRNLFSNFYSKRFDVGSPYCERLHFFDIEDVEPEDLCVQRQLKSPFNDNYFSLLS